MVPVPVLTHQVDGYADAALARAQLGGLLGVMARYTTSWMRGETAAANGPTESELKQAEELLATMRPNKSVSVDLFHTFREQQAWEQTRDNDKDDALLTRQIQQMERQMQQSAAQTREREKEGRKVLDQPVNESVSREQSCLR